MQTQQRRIPIGGDNGKNKTWKELLPYYEEELAKFRNNIQLLKSSSHGENKKIEALAPAKFKYWIKSFLCSQLLYAKNIYRSGCQYYWHRR